ncbi:hypothetical protein [Rheinheimera sp. F8]|uniref:hypothetical protein n=1 Tax=Rheinheimera sp. F8 TaxID=1763998 RepID=UPI00074488F3|nr:hypothetical protein [Rheinheimera sp. F8]ALZ76738.1 hypothetical protein ATY27_13850 [Rheinheimera sp. F8]
MLKLATKYALLIIVILSFAGFAAHANTRSQSEETVRDSKISYIAKYEDGTSERIVVHYTANYSHRIWQSGRGWTIDHAFDNRKCNIETKGDVLRRAYIVTRSGISAPIEQYQKVYSDVDITDRGPDNNFEALTRHVTCGVVMTEFKKRVARKRTSIVKSFQTIISSYDLQNRKELQAMLGATELVVAK